jgi:hypothetical protein
MSMQNDDNQIASQLDLATGHAAHKTSKWCLQWDHRLILDGLLTHPDTSY